MSAVHPLLSRVTENASTFPGDLGVVSQNTDIRLSSTVSKINDASFVKFRMPLNFQPLDLVARNLSHIRTTLQRRTVDTAYEDLLTYQLRGRIGTSAMHVLAAEAIDSIPAIHPDWSRIGCLSEWSSRLRAIFRLACSRFSSSHGA